MQDFKSYICEATQKASGSKSLPAGTEIDPNAMYLVQSDFKNFFKDVQLSKLRYMKGSDLMKIDPSETSSTYGIKVALLTANAPIGTLQTYYFYDQDGYRYLTIKNVIDAINRKSVKYTLKIGRTKQDAKNYPVGEMWYGIDEFVTDEQVEFLYKNISKLPYKGDLLKHIKTLVKQEYKERFKNKK